MDRMLRTNCPADSSKAMYKTRSPRRQAASTKWAARLVLPVPAVPETRTLGAPIIASAAQHRVQPRHAAGNPLVGDRVPQAQRSDRQDGEAVFVDQERAFVGT